MYLTQPLHKGKRERPDVQAVVFAERRHSFAEFTGRVARLAGVLQRLGIGTGDRVGLLAMHSDRYIEFLLAVLWGGGVFNTVNIRWSAREAVYCSTIAVRAFCSWTMPSCPWSTPSANSRTPWKPSSISASTTARGYVGLSRTDGRGHAGRGRAARRRRSRGDSLYRRCHRCAQGRDAQPRQISIAARSARSCRDCRRDRVVALHSAPFFHVAEIGLILQVALRQGTSDLAAGLRPAGGAVRYRPRAGR